MNTPLTHKPGHHPMMILAAIAIILFCLVGTAAIMGWLPSSIGGNAAGRGDLTEADRAALAAKIDTPVPTQPPVQQQFVQEPVRQVRDPEPRYAPEPTPAPSMREADYRPAQVAAAAPAKNWCEHCGNVESVREITTRAQGSGVGAAGGAILGGLLGNQVGSGHGRQLATVAGAVGGAVVGNQVEGNMKANHSYEIRVRMDDGKYRTFHQSSPGWRAGDRVRVVKGGLRSVH
jgi:outer membrane lipoprotein SlyB